MASEVRIVQFNLYCLTLTSEDSDLLPQKGYSLSNLLIFEKSLNFIGHISSGQMIIALDHRDYSPDHKGQ